MNLGGSIRINKCGVFILVFVILLFLYYLSVSKSNSSGYGLSKNPDEINLRKLLIGTIQAAQRGGVEVVAISKKPDFQTQSKGKTKEGANDPVTEADFNSHCVMLQGLHRIFPKLKIVSEEDGDKGKCPESTLFDLDPTVLHENAIIPDELVNTDDLTVWIDPLDATQEFTERLFEYVTTMLCVAIKGKPVIGVIHNPFTEKTIWAWAGRAYSEELLRVKREEEVKNPIMIISRSHTGDANEYIKQTFGENSHAIKAGGAGESYKMKSENLIRVELIKLI